MHDLKDIDVTALRGKLVARRSGRRGKVLPLLGVLYAEGFHLETLPTHTRRRPTRAARAALDSDRIRPGPHSRRAGARVPGAHVDRH